MKNIYKISMYLNLTVAIFLGIGLITALSSPHIEVTGWTIFAIPAFLLSYYLFRKKYQEIIDFEKRLQEKLRKRAK
ncbi:hypothetical protein [Evansella halocellulosilytica]|uniref:hypothetical protein n=1 Tax=Evansella halocellulosilytica TaxID=2011013 RepID=UPI000BB6FF83|nr:hypothetical protein [Evansella halocellulosilytica]